MSSSGFFCWKNGKSASGSTAAPAAEGSGGGGVDARDDAVSAAAEGRPAATDDVTGAVATALVTTTVDAVVAKNGCCNRALAVGRALFGIWQHCRTTSANNGFVDDDDDVDVEFGVGISGSFPKVATRNITAIPLLISANGGLPLAISNNVAPKLQISALSSYPSPCTTSGAM